MTENPIASFMAYAEAFEIGFAKKDWNILHVQFGVLLHEIQLFETEKNGMIYNGDLQTNVF